jgi:exopolyphosphatase/guanosine-5'-triphosphate,3'-diphosphate pyrophosphatase
VIESTEIDRVVDWLASMTLAERRKLTALDPYRADVIVTGGIIVQAIASAAEARSLVVSDRGVRWGLIRSLANPTSSP